MASTLNFGDNYTIPQLFTFNLSGTPPLTCSAGDSWRLEIVNETSQGNRVITVHPVVNGNFSSVVLPVEEPDILLVKTVQPISDPVHGTTPNAYAIPGAIMRYAILAINTGLGAADRDSVMITDAIPAQTDLVVSGSPVTFVNGAVPSGLTFTLADDVTFLDASDNPIATPTADGNGVDQTIRKIVINPKGIFLGSTGPNPSFSVIFNVRVK